MNALERNGEVRQGTLAGKIEWQPSLWERTQKSRIVAWVSLRLRPGAKARLLPAAALRNTDLTAFVLGGAMREADAVIEQAEHLKLSARDGVRVLAMLENPPAPNAELRAAAGSLPSGV